MVFGPFKLIGDFTENLDSVFSRQRPILSHFLRNIDVGTDHVRDHCTVSFLHSFVHLDVLNAHPHYGLLLRFLRQLRILASTNPRPTAGPRVGRRRLRLQICRGRYPGRRTLLDGVGVASRMWRLHRLLLIHYGGTGVFVQFLVGLL